MVVYSLTLHILIFTHPLEQVWYSYDSQTISIFFSSTLSPTHFSLHQMHLLEAIIRQRAKAKHGFANKMMEIPALDDSAINNHLLLFTSALVPKVLSSICTSLCVEIGFPEKVDKVIKSLCAVLPRWKLKFNGGHKYTIIIWVWYASNIGNLTISSYVRSVRIFSF